MSLNNTVLLVGSDYNCISVAFPKRLAPFTPSTLKHQPIHFPWDGLLFTMYEWNNISELCCSLPLEETITTVTED